MAEAFEVRPGPMYSSEKPARDPAYLRWIKRLPCLACLTTWWIDPCHTGPHGIGQKSSDYSAIPLCRRHHREYDACPWKFVYTYHLDIPALIEMFNHFYTQQRKDKAA